MVALSRTNRTAFRRAVFASVVLHIALGAITIIILSLALTGRPQLPASTRVRT